MAELKLEEMLKIIRDDEHYRNDTFNRVNGSMPFEKSWYSNDTMGKARFLDDLKDNPAAPAKAVKGVIPGYTDAAYAGLAAALRHDMLTDLEMTQYKKDQKQIQEEQKLNQKKGEYGQSFRFWRNIAIPTVAAGALAIFGRSQIPSVSIDESVAQYEVQKQEVDVQDYMRTHEGKSPPWQKSPEQIRMDTAKDYTLEKSALYGIGILGVLGGIISGIASAIYFGLSKRK